MRHYLLIVGILCAWLGMAADANACSCLPPDKGRSYDNADHVVHARVQRLLTRTSTTLYYIATLVEDDYKGCLTAKQLVIIQTPSSSASCGISLRGGEEYLLHGSRVGTLLGVPRLGVILCDANLTFSTLSAEHRVFLESRYVCCGGTCACTDGTQPVNCFVDPCQVSSCDVEGATCRSNYCGGCNAEWYDPTGALVCEASTPSE